MIRRKVRRRAVPGAAVLRFANQNAYQNMADAGAMREGAAARTLERASARLQETAESLEAALAAVPPGAGRADLHEAIGTIMDTLRLVASVHARLDRCDSAGAAVAD